MLRIILIILGIVVAALGGVIAYRALFLEPGTAVVINQGTGAAHEYPDMLRVVGGLLMFLGGCCVAFFASLRKSS